MIPLRIGSILGGLRKVSPKAVIAHRKRKKFLQDILRNPENPVAHGNLGDQYATQKKWIEAIAEYRTSLSLGATDKLVYLALANAYSAFGQVELARSVLGKILSDGDDKATAQAVAIQSKLQSRASRPLGEFNHNRYYRLRTLADHITNLCDNSNISLLDIGGGDGALSLFLPDCRYVLAEPTVNGLSVNDFSEKSFDIVVACHVLEHILTEERSRFLDSLASRAKHYVVLLNPFFQPGEFLEERLKLVIKLTNSPWAKEHMHCTLPTLQELQDFALGRDYEIKISPNGSLATTLAFVFLDHYASSAGRINDLKEINNFYNTFFFNKLTDSKVPTGYLVELRVASTYKGKCL